MSLMGLSYLVLVVGVLVVVVTIFGGTFCLGTGSHRCLNAFDGYDGGRVWVGGCSWGDGNCCAIFVYIFQDFIDSHEASYYDDGYTMCWMS